jgi:hypothetical protein
MSVANTQQALQELYRDMGAASSKASSASLWSTWVRFHQEWFGPGVEAVPLTQEKVFAVAACFKKGGCKSFPSYLAKAKEQHIFAGRG